MALDNLREEHKPFLASQGLTDAPRLHLRAAYTGPFTYNPVITIILPPCEFHVKTSNFTG
jgi:hypothetical protein